MKKTYTCVCERAAGNEKRSTGMTAVRTPFSCSDPNQEQVNLIHQDLHDEMHVRLLY